MEIRPMTRQAFEAALRTAGDIPSVRKIHAQIGGSYNVLTAEVRALREETAASPPAAPPPCPARLAPATAAGTPDPVMPRLAAACGPLITALQQDVRLCHDVELRLQQIQRNRTGPLTDWLAALVRVEDAG